MIEEAEIANMAATREEMVNAQVQLAIGQAPPEERAKIPPEQVQNIHDSIAKIVALQAPIPAPGEPESIVREWSWAFDPEHAAMVLGPLELEGGAFDVEEEEAPPQQTHFVPPPLSTPAAEPEPATTPPVTLLPPDEDTDEPEAEEAARPTDKKPTTKKPKATKKTAKEATGDEDTSA